MYDAFCSFADFIPSPAWRYHKILVLTPMTPMTRQGGALVNQRAVAVAHPLPLLAVLSVLTRLAGTHSTIMKSFSKVKPNARKT